MRLSTYDAYKEAAVSILGTVDHAPVYQDRIAMAQVWAILALAASIRETRED